MVELTVQPPEVRAASVSPVTLQDETPPPTRLEDLGELLGRAKYASNTAARAAGDREAYAAGLQIAENRFLNVDQSIFDAETLDFEDEELNRLGLIVADGIKSDTRLLDLAEGQTSRSSLNDLRRNALMRRAIANNPYYAEEIYKGYKAGEGPTTRAINLNAEKAERAAEQARLDNLTGIVKEYNLGYLPADQALNVAAKLAKTLATIQETELSQRAFEAKRAVNNQGTALNEDQLAANTAVWKLNSGNIIFGELQTSISAFRAAIAKSVEEGTPINKASYRSQLEQFGAAAPARIAAQYGVPVSEVQTIFNSQFQIIKDDLNALLWGTYILDDERVLDAQSKMLQHRADILLREDYLELVKIPGAPRAINALGLIRGMDPLMIQNLLQKMTNANIQIDVEGFLIRALSRSFDDTVKTQGFIDAAVEMGYSVEIASKVASDTLGVLNDSLARMQLSDAEGIMGSAREFMGESVSDLQDLTVKVMNTVASEDFDKADPRFLNEVSRFMGNKEIANNLIGAMSVMNPKAADNLTYALQEDYLTMVETIAEEARNYVLTPQRGAVGGNRLVAKDLNPKVIGSFFGINFTGGTPGTADRIKADPDTVNGTEFLQVDVTPSGEIKFTPVAEYASEAAAVDAAREMTRIFGQKYGYKARAYAHLVMNGNSYQEAGASMARAGGYNLSSQTQEEIDAAAAARDQVAKQRAAERARAAGVDPDVIESVLGN